MIMPELDHAAIIRANTDDYESGTHPTKWLGRDEAAQARGLRADLLRSMAGKAGFAFNDTKPFHRAISRGCHLCGEGAWSCLFINNLCNAGCFFCPARQDNHDEPGTSTLTFSSPEDYCDYLQEFGFKGASISGGEPLLAFDRTLSFLRHIKERFGEGMYVWLYTNGTLAGEETFRVLSDAGLDEVRFNITATGYDLAKAQMASRYIGTVTVEIPAIPEDLDIMKKKIPEMAERGVSYLNLHQIRCTPFNCGKLSGRGYTFLHGPQIGVLESELTALKLLGHAMDNGIALGINYCSLIYRHRFQTRSSRRRLAPLMCKPFEDVTDAGMIRMLCMDGEPRTIGRIAQELQGTGAPASRISLNMDRTRLWLPADLLALLGEVPSAVKLSYAVVSLRPGITYTNPFRELRLPSGKKIAMERATAYMDLELGGQEIGLFQEAFGKGRDPLDPDALYEKALAMDPSGENAGKWQRIMQAEAIRSGLLEYY